MIAFDEPFTPSEASMFSPVVLAFVGDAVYELMARRASLHTGLPADPLHRLVVQWVSAEGQSAVLDFIESMLTAEESNIVRRGRNAKVTGPRRADVAVYRRSTALEALVGFLFLTAQKERLRELMAPMTEGIARAVSPTDAF